MSEPNKNIMIVQEIENLANEIMYKLRELKSTNYSQNAKVEQAKDGMNLWEEVDLFAVREVFE